MKREIRKEREREIQICRVRERFTERDTQANAERETHTDSRTVQLL
jgi:hypothetical protein